MFTKWIASGSTLALIMLISIATAQEATFQEGINQAKAPSLKDLEELSAKTPISIDAQVEALKLEDVGSFKDNHSTRTTIRFTGKLGEHEVRPGTDVLVQLAAETRVFKFAPVGFREEGIGGEGDDFPVFHYFRLEWNYNGPVRWTMYALPSEAGAKKK